MSNKLKINSKYMTLIGWMLIILGVFAILAPYIAGSAIVICWGVIIFLAGMASLTHGFNSYHKEEKLLSVVIGLIAIICGLAVLLHPILGLAILTLILAFYLIADGVWKVIISLQYEKLIR